MVPRLSYLKKAYERCKEQAKDSGLSLDEVVSERFGVWNLLTCSLS